MKKCDNALKSKVSGVIIGRPQGPLIPIARITRTQGLQGEVRVRIDFDDMRLFGNARPVVLTLGDRQAESSIEELRFQHGRWVLKLENIDTIADAETWVGGQVSILEEELPEPEKGSYYDFDLAGCEVYDGENRIGMVTAVESYGSTALLSISKEGREILIPFVQRFLRSVDIEGRRIEVTLPEGLVDLNPGS